jgi:hypothetical protein
MTLRGDLSLYLSLYSIQLLEVILDRRILMSCRTHQNGGSFKLERIPPKMGPIQQSENSSMSAGLIASFVANDTSRRL